MRSVFFLCLVSLTINANSVLGQEEEQLPLPIHAEGSTNVDSARATKEANMAQAALKKSIRVQRAMYIAAQRTELEVAQRWSGYYPARPTINAGYIFNAAPGSSIRWYNRFYAPPYTYSYMYGVNEGVIR